MANRHSRIALELGVLCLAVVLPVFVAAQTSLAGSALWSARPAAAQDDPSRLEDLRQQLESLETIVGTLRSLEGELRDASLVAVPGSKRVDFVDRAALRESLRLRVTQTIAADASTPEALARLADETLVNSMVAALERKATEESNAFLEKLTNDRAFVETRIRLIREELARATAASGQLARAPQTPPAQGTPASRLVCPSPLFGELLWSGSSARCIGEGFALFPGWRFDNPADLVCARCTPSCSFAETTGGRLICVVTGAPAAAPATAGSPPAPGTPARPPSPRRIYSLSGTWRPAAGGVEVTVMTGGPNRYSVSGTGAGRIRNEGTLVGDGTSFEGRFHDVPGYCCGREGYVWLEAIDENTYRVRSAWWTPGQGSKDRPQLTFGWTTWRRR